MVKLSEVFIILERSMGFVRSGLGIHCFRLSSERFQGARIGYCVADPGVIERWWREAPEAPAAPARKTRSA